MHNRSKIFRFSSMGRFLKYSNRFTAYNPYPIEFKFVKCQNETSRSAQSFVAVFYDFPTGGAVMLRLSDYLNRPSAHSSYPIERNGFRD